MIVKPKVTLVNPNTNLPFIVEFDVVKYHFTEEAARELMLELTSALNALDLRKPNDVDSGRSWG